jgi:hypothetical protein
VSSESNIAATTLSNSGREPRSRPTETTSQRGQDLAFGTSLTPGQALFGSTRKSIYIRFYEVSELEVATWQKSQQTAPSQAQSGTHAQYNPFGARSQHIDNISSSVFWRIANPSATLIGGTPGLGKSMLLVSPRRFEDWKQQDDERFDVLVEKEARGQLDDKEANELDQLSQKRDRTVVSVPEEDLRQERMRSEALAELQALLQKYAPLFSSKR